MSILSPPSRADIISLCTSLPCEGYMGTTTIWHDPRTSKPLFFIKYGNYVLAEGRTQQHLYDRAQSDARAPRIPQIYDVFTDDPTGREFIVMEFVPAPTLTQWLALATSDSEREARTEDGSHRVLDAIAWLYALDVSQDGPLGPVGGGIAHHRFFADHTAPMPFASTDALQAYINTGLARAPLRARTTIDLAGEELSFYHSDIRPDNFLVDEGGIWMVDFEHVGVLPSSFASYALRTADSMFLPAIRTLWPVSPNCAKLGRAAGLILQCSDKSLGLNKKKKQKKKQPPPPPQEAICI